MFLRAVTTCLNLPQVHSSCMRASNLRQNMFESESRNYAYEMMELEMSIET